MDALQCTRAVRAAQWSDCALHTHCSVLRVPPTFNVLPRGLQHWKYGFEGKTQHQRLCAQTQDSGSCRQALKKHSRRGCEGRRVGGCGHRTPRPISMPRCAVMVTKHAAPQPPPPPFSPPPRSHYTTQEESSPTHLQRLHDGKSKTENFSPARRQEPVPEEQCRGQVNLFTNTSRTHTPPRFTNRQRHPKRGHKQEPPTPTTTITNARLIDDRD
jgi:hypothetical protein